MPWTSPIPNACRRVRPRRASESCLWSCAAWACACAPRRAGGGDGARLAVAVWVRVEVAAPPAEQQAQGEHHDHHPDGGLGRALERLGQVGLEQHDRQAEEGERERVAGSPRQAEPAGAACAVLGVRRDQRGNGGEVVGVGRVPQPQEQRHQQGERHAAALGELGDPFVKPEHRSPPRPSAGRPPRPAARRRSPPSFGGSSSGTSTRSPSPSSRARVQLEQGAVLEHAPGEDHGRRRPCRSAAVAHAVAVAVARALWKRAEMTGTGTPRADVASRPRGSSRARRAAPRLAGERQRVGAARGRVGDRLELDRRLPLVVHLGPDAAQRRHGVEEPADARRERRHQPGPPARPPGARRCADPGRARPRGSAGCSPSAAVSQAHAIRHGCAHRGIAAGSRTGKSRPARSKPSRPPRAARRPRPCRPPVAAAVEDRADRGARLPVLGEAGR